ncbi:MAG: GNAT family N-acetyltransferase, partial [Alphaproteobacteria bacterium]
MRGRTGIILRAEEPGDRPVIRAVTEAAFGTREEAYLIDALHAGGDVVVSLVAETEGRIAGHVLLSRLASPERCLALAPVSVAPGLQGAGVGSALIREALSRAAAAGYEAVFVLGEPAYYTRFGFSPDAAAPFETDYPKDYFMALELKPGTLAGKAGRVIYPRA